MSNVVFMLKIILTGLGNWSAGWHLVDRAVKEAERLGYWGVVFPDQYMWDPKDLGVESTEGIDSTLDTWTALTYLAARTWTIKLGTWVTPIPLRPPGVLAKQVATLDVLSKGRTILGVGAGITQRMFEGYSEWDPPRVRVDKTEEGLDLILKLWHEDKVDHKGTHYSAKGAILSPKPAQKPHPPLLFGGAGKRMLKLAGRYADICYIPNWNKMNHVTARKIVLDEAQRYGREKQVAFAEAYTPLAPTDQYDIKEYQKRAEDAVKNGFEYFITAFAWDIAPWEVNKSNAWQVEKHFMNHLIDFGRKIIPLFKK